MSGKMNPALNHQIRALSRVIYFVTEEEDQFILKLKNVLKRSVEHTFVFNSAFGLRPITEYINDWTSRKHEEAPDNKRTIHDALIDVYKSDPKNNIHFYVFTDPEVHLRADNVQVHRRVLNIIHQLNNDIRNIKILIFVGSSRVIPASLARYIQVVQDTGLEAEEIHEIVSEACTSLQMKVPEDTATAFAGLTTYEIKTAIAQSVIRGREEGREKGVLHTSLIKEFKKQQLQKTDLVQYIDTENLSFDELGGAQRFKQWAIETRAAWTPKGQKFGLKPPKGVLCVGVWGCGKSLATKTMGHAWGLPVIQLEMGRMRAGQVGGSEANIYRALRLIEAAAPCIVWLDEAEKSLSGMQSSAQTDSGITARIIGIFSTWLQETKAQVTVAMTANSLNTLPVEFVNRMDERFYFTLPTVDDRVDIIKIHLRKAGQDPERFENLVDLADKAADMVGREIEQAIGAAMRASYNADKEHLDEGILGEILQKKPRIVRTMTDEIKLLEDWVGYDSNIDDGIRARFASNPVRSTRLTSVG